MEFAGHHGKRVGVAGDEGEDRSPAGAGARQRLPDAPRSARDQNVGTAQRGWLTKEDVINAWPLSKLRTFLKKRRT